MRHGRRTERLVPWRVNRQPRHGSAVRYSVPVLVRLRRDRRPGPDLTAGGQRRHRALVRLSPGRAVTASLAICELIATSSRPPRAGSPPGTTPASRLPRRPRPVWPCATASYPPSAVAVGAVSALGSAALGIRLRALAARRFGSDLPGAFVEDALADTLAWLFIRRR